MVQRIDASGSAGGISPMTNNNLGFEGILVKLNNLPLGDRLLFVYLFLVFVVLAAHEILCPKAEQ